MKYLQQTILTLLFLFTPLIAVAADSCKPDADMVQLIKDMAKNPKLSQAIKKNLDLAKVWKELEDIKETELNNEPEILDIFLKIPTPVRGKFQEWWDELTIKQAETVWGNSELQSRIRNNLREPSDPGMHEWCMVCRALTFKKWGVTAKEIEIFRTETTKLKWTAPEDSGATNPGEAGGHGGNGSGTFHNELKRIIDTSGTYSEFKQRLTGLISRWDIDPETVTIP